MADTCLLDDMIEGAKCINKQLSPDEKLAAQAFYLCAALDGCDPVNCDLDAQVERAKCLKHFASSDLVGFQVYSDYLNAVANGASPLNGSMDELQEGIKCLRLLDMVQLQALVLSLRCALRECESPIIT